MVKDKKKERLMGNRLLLSRINLLRRGRYTLHFLRGLLPRLFTAFRLLRYKAERKKQRELGRNLLKIDQQCSSSSLETVNIQYAFKGGIELGVALVSIGPKKTGPL